MTREERNKKIEFFQSEANSMKSALIRLEDEMVKVSTRKAYQLSRIIEKLEKWQNTK
jgi:hypothetical protein